MELMKNAKIIKLRSYHDKYLLADEDEEHVSQSRNGSGRNANWSIEFPETSDSLIRLRSIYGRYLTASNEPFLLGVTGRKVLQTLPPRLDSSVEWEPVRDGFQVKLKTRYGQYLRGNGGLPPWRNSITHDIPLRTATQEWVLWDVEVVEGRSRADTTGNGGEPGKGAGKIYPPPPPPPLDLSMESGMPKSEGRLVFYAIAEDNGSTDSSNELSFSFNGTTVAELTQKLEEITEITDGIIICTKNPLNQALCPIRLHLPPDNSTLHVAVVRSSSKGANSLG